ncbi:hypothetical protein DAPPUDRAFT_113042 [Daphnia pulex]|uniref:Uncharacterized protein n=1 Tax=Daphnia pulex TaxID=6669 RepID=E9HDW8_DAPPU|nr:hypothetical protein DAPPUDRAFT_113042 [Daphnia pulex]|eukprot:EFX70103.1 hypothetical protein DAPPUDRAFT_113042 [Daphnia pulex]
MAGRGRLLLEPGFVHDEVDLPKPPVVGQVIEWPLPKTEYQSYPSDADLHTSPSPSNDPEPEPEPTTSSTSTDDQQKTRGVKRPSTARFPKVKYNRLVLSPIPKHLRPGNHYDNSSSSENDEPTMRFVPATDECPELALAIMTAQAKFINKMEILQRAFYKELEEINDHFAEDHY